VFNDGDGDDDDDDDDDERVLKSLDQSKRVTKP
jgi:hypothetical protein